MGLPTTLLAAIGLCGYAAGLNVPALSSSPRPASAALRLRQDLLRAQSNDDDDALDAMDTSDAWDDQLAEQRAWEAAMAAKNKPKETPAPAPPAADSSRWDGEIDESAWFDEADDESDKDRVARQLAEKQASLLLSRIEGSGGAATAGAVIADGPSTKRVMTSLESVLNAISRLSDKVDALSDKVDRALLSQQGGGGGESTAAPSGTSSSPPPPPPAPAAEAAPPSPPAPAPGRGDAKWDGEVDEGAWFDEEDDGVEFADWRDVRRLKAMLERTEAVKEEKEEEEGPKKKEDEDEDEDGDEDDAGKQQE